ncbi:hypothetical protein JCM33374_g1356 [Metschnikowia sp. JCM 33374]|nr:hypothetical protein JCM33374_g1356 [Metschnikowia sp. JCM 33374]
MFRPVFKASLRSGVSAASRRYTTIRPARTVPTTKLAALTGLSIVASMALFLPGSSVNNDTNEEKLQQDIELAENAAEVEKTAFELAEEAEQLKEAAEADAANLSAAPQAEKTEESGSQSAAFNPETGEINWDCPCLGGMAHGPCGEEFKAAFACFVYSETEPKGIDCIGKFEAMRTCFRQHPEHYKEELYDDGEAVPSTDEKTPAESAKPVEKVEKVEKVEQAKPSETVGAAPKDTPATEDIPKVA